MSLRQGAQSTPSWAVESQTSRRKPRRNLATPERLNTKFSTDSLGESTVFRALSGAESSEVRRDLLYGMQRPWLLGLSVKCIAAGLPSGAGDPKLLHLGNQRGTLQPQL